MATSKTAKKAAKKAVAKTVEPMTAVGRGVSAPTKAFGRLSLPYNTLTVKELETKVGILEEAVIVIRKSAGTKLGGYFYSGKTVAGRPRAIAKSKTLKELQDRLSDYGLAPKDYEVVSSSLKDAVAESAAAAV